jgi:predicted O-linked N-acetylglucosamine transferase (SPINDLY family)
MSLYKLIGQTDLIAKDIRDYIDIAFRLVLDENFRNNQRMKIINSFNNDSNNNSFLVAAEWIEFIAKLFV